MRSEKYGSLSGCRLTAPAPLNKDLTPSLATIWLEASNMLL